MSPTEKPLTEDVIDVLLRLKSKHLKPKDFRQALKSPNPKVREFVAKHPQLPKPLVKEILQSNDAWLRDLVSKRHDLQEESTQAELPAGLNLDHHSFAVAKEDSLRKSIGYVSFPHFGVLAGDKDSQGNLFDRLLAQHGPQAKSIAQKLVSQLAPQEKEHLHALTSKFVHPQSKADDQRIAYLRHYLTDPVARKQMHPKLPEGHLLHLEEHEAQHAQDAADHVSVVQARKVWDRLRGLANQLKPEHLHAEVIKSEIQIWKDSLQKNSEQQRFDSVAGQLGLDTAVQDYLDAINLVTGQHITTRDVKRFVAQAGGDMFQAALMAAALESQQQVEAVERALKFVQVYKSEENPQTVTPITPDAADVAKIIQAAAKEGNLSPIDLDGRYSTGALLAEEDETGAVYLLKPDSAKKSPAMGMQDSPSSSIEREAAFWRVARMLGLDGDVPETKLVQVDGKPYAAIEFLGTDYATLEKIRQVDPFRVTFALTPYLKSGQIFKWSILDWMTGNVDRHGNNMMMGDGNEPKLIDQGSSFAGDNFAPGQDKDSFVPFYLRVWTSSKDFQALDLKERLTAMPIADVATDQRLREWVQKIDETELAHELQELKVDPNPVLNRLKTLKQLSADSDNFSESINKLWAS